MTWSSAVRRGYNEGWGQGMNGISQGREQEDDWERDMGRLLEELRVGTSEVEG